MLSIMAIIASFLAALILTGIVRKILIRRNLLDRPNERSSHIVPVPRGGGWAIIGILVPALAATLFLPMADFSLHVRFLVGLLLLVFISWLDDRQHVSARWRLSLHLFAAGLAVSGFPASQTIFGGHLPFLLDRAITIIGWAWFMNLYNFMDGIDGITGVETIAIVTGTSLLMTATGFDDPYIGLLTLLLTGSCLGFLAYNWHPARIFLGDVGSVPLGYLAGFCLVTLAMRGWLVPALILPLYYLADSGITLAKRALRREKIWQAHRQHFYQRAAQGVGRHDRVTLWIALANIALIALSLLGVSRPAAAFGAAVLVVALLLGKMHKLGRFPDAPRRI